MNRALDVHYFIAAAIRVVKLHVFTFLSVVKFSLIGVRLQSQFSIEKVKAILNSCRLFYAAHALISVELVIEL